MLGLALQRTLDAANDRIEALEASNARLRSRNELVLPIVVNASDALVPVFGPIDYRGTNDSDTALLLHAEDGLAEIKINPANGRIAIEDPEHAIDGVTVTLNDQGELSTDELAAIRRFRADVLFTRQDGNGYSGGPVSLVVKSANGTARGTASVPVA